MAALRGPLLTAVLISVLGLIALHQKQSMYGAREPVEGEWKINVGRFRGGAVSAARTAAIPGFDTQPDSAIRSGLDERHGENFADASTGSHNGQGENETTISRPRLILGVASAPWAVEHRKALRETVGSCLQTAPRLGPSMIQLVFFTDADSHVTKLVREEQDLYNNDVITTPTCALGQLMQKDVRLIEYLRQARELNNGKGADLYGKMDDDVFVCPHNIAKLLSGLSSNSYLGTASARGKKTHDQQFVIFGKDVVDAVISLHDAAVVSRETPQEESKYLHKLISQHADTQMAIDYQTFAPMGSAITHIRDNRDGKPCMRSFEECPFKFKTGPEFCNGIRVGSTRNSNISFHRFRDKFKEPKPGKTLRKYFVGVCKAGEEAWGDS